MIQQYNALPSAPLQVGADFVRPLQNLPGKVALHDPATWVMTDLHTVSVVSVRTQTPVDKANARMIRYAVRMLVVLDDHEQVAGLLTANDVLGEKPMRFMQEMGIGHGGIKVSDIMTPQREIEVLDIHSVLTAKVGDIVASLKKGMRQHALVVELDGNGKQAVCGLFSLTQIARQLGVETRSFDIARLFTEIDAIN